MELHNGVCFCCNSNRVLTFFEPEKLQEVFQTLFSEQDDINLVELKQKVIRRKAFEICPICYYKMKWMLKISDTMKEVETCFKKWSCLICQTKDNIIKIENWNHFTEISNFGSDEERAYICLDCLFYLDFRHHIKQKMLSKFPKLKQTKKQQIETISIFDSSDDELPIKPKLDLSILKQYKPLKVDRKLKKLRFINDDPKFLLQIPYVVLDLNKHLDQQRNPQTDEKDISRLISKDDTLLSKSKHPYFKIKLKIPHRKTSPQSRKAHKFDKKLKVDKRNLKSEFNDSLIIKLERLNASPSALQEDNGSDAESGSSLDESIIKKPAEVDQQEEETSAESGEFPVKNDDLSEGSKTKKYPSDNELSDTEGIEDELENTKKKVTHPNLYEEAMETDNIEPTTEKKLTEETNEDDKHLNSISENGNSQMEVEEPEESIDKIKDTSATANMVDITEDNGEKEAVSEDKNESADHNTCDKDQDAEKEESAKEIKKKNKKYKPGPKSKKKQYLEPESNIDEKSNDSENTITISDDKTVNNEIEESNNKPADEDEVKSETDRKFEETKEKKRRHKPGPKSRRFKETNDESDIVDVDQNNGSENLEDEETNGVEKTLEEPVEILNDSEKSDVIDLLSAFEEDESKSLTQSNAEDDPREDIDTEGKEIASDAIESEGEIASDAIESEKEIENTENNKENGTSLSISDNSEHASETLKRKQSENDSLDVSISPDKKKKRVTFSDDVFPL